MKLIYSNYFNMFPSLEEFTKTYNTFRITNSVMIQNYRINQKAGNSITYCKK